MEFLRNEILSLPFYDAVLYLNQVKIEFLYPKFEKTIFPQGLYILFRFVWQHVFLFIHLCPPKPRPSIQPHIDERIVLLSVLVPHFGQ